ncbi:MAG: c-type cytochrome [Pseudomonadales bacterium]|nr:cytochrome c5 family protein [Pseudomonadales bacterium]
MIRFKLLATSYGRFRNAKRSLRPLLLTVTAGLLGCGEPGADGGGAQSTAGEDTYNRYCFSCHAAGVAGAPKTGDVEAWAPRIAKGPELLLSASKSGVPPGMPPMGLCTSCSDEEMAAAIEYMVSRSR